MGWECIYLQGQVWGAQCSPHTPHSGLCFCLSLAMLAKGAEGNSSLAWNTYEPEKGKERGLQLCGAAAFAMTLQHAAVLTGHLLPSAFLPCHHPIPATLPPASLTLSFPDSLSPFSPAHESSAAPTPRTPTPGSPAAAQPAAPSLAFHPASSSWCRVQRRVRQRGCVMPSPPSGVSGCRQGCSSPTHPRASPRRPWLHPDTRGRAQRGIVLPWSPEMQEEKGCCSPHSTTSPRTLSLCAPSCSSGKGDASHLQHQELSWR